MDDCVLNEVGRGLRASFDAAGGALVDETLGAPAVHPVTTVDQPVGVAVQWMIEPLTTNDLPLDITGQDGEWRSTIVCAAPVEITAIRFVDR